MNEEDDILLTGPVGCLAALSFQYSRNATLSRSKISIVRRAGELHAREGSNSDVGEGPDLPSHSLL